MLAINDLHVSVENKEIIKGLTLQIKPGEVHAVMGPNGSGKSTLAYALAGHPKYETRNEKRETRIIDLDGEDISEKTPDERARMGLFLATQHPMSVPGLTAINFLWQIYKTRNQKRETRNENGTGEELKHKLVSLIEFRKWMTQQAKALGLDESLLKRGLNDGFSGGEKKKMEVLQMLVVNPKYVILDEIDSGLDVDALKKIGQTVAKMAEINKSGVLVITHHSRILDYLKPTHVHVIKDGKIIEEGGIELVEKVESYGFDKVEV